MHEQQSYLSTITLDPIDTPEMKADPSYFLVVEGGSSRIYPLPSEGEVIIGRAHDANMRLSDASVSRWHMKITVRAGEIVASDMGSHNGTRVNGQPPGDICALTSGDVLTLGDVVLVLHRGRGVLHHNTALDLAALRQRLAEEVERTRRYGRPTALILLDTDAQFDKLRVEKALFAQLRRIDAYAYVSATQLAFVLPDVDESELQDISERLLEMMRPLAPNGRAGCVLCPMDGSDVDALILLSRRAAESATRGTVAVRPDPAQHRKIGEHDVLLADAAMLRLYDLVDKLAVSSLPVLIHGETGTGKESVAAALHHQSPRRTQRMVAINCAALPENLAESELFGFERGAFSGATSAKVGLLESARGGTVFLDEIGELSIAVQAKLLRVLETKRLVRLGDIHERPVDIRLVAATHRDLEAETAAGRFRRDLFFRLNAAVVRIPPLRHRHVEIPLLSRAFLSSACASLGRKPVLISDRVMAMLCAYSWPGNLRELKNDMAYLAAIVETTLVEPWHLPSKFAPPKDEPASSGPKVPLSRAFRPIEEELRELEQQRMREALEAVGGVQTRAADLIAMPRRTFFAKMKHYGLSVKGSR